MIHSSTNSSVVRFGIIVDDCGLSDWELKCILNLTESHNGTLALILFLEPFKQANNLDNNKLRMGNCIRWLYRRIFFRQASLQLVQNKVLMQTFPSAEQYKENISETPANEPLDMEKLHKLDLDFVLGFTNPHKLWHYRHIARHGVWWFSQDDSSSYFGAVPFIDNMLNGEVTVQPSLRSYNAIKDSSEELWHGCYAINRSSYGTDLERVLHDLSKWPLWICHRIRNGSLPKNFSSFSFDRTTSQRRASLSKMLGWPVYMLWSKFNRKISNVFLRPQWNVAILRRPIHTLLTQQEVNDAEFLDIGTNKDVFWADPFGCFNHGIFTILFEHYDFNKNKGHIASIKVPASGIQTHQETIFDRPYHLSYPFIFEDDGNIYCVPESGHAGIIEIHKAVQFPLVWECIAVVDEGRSATDSTVFRHNGTWWIACTMIEHEINTNLFLYHADTLTGPWVFHKTNPVKTDVRSSRPAGTPFVFRGELYRPSQDCSQSYGRQVCINRVLRLDSSEFVEEPFCWIEPTTLNGYPNGLHTISSVNDWTLIDGLRHILIWKGIVISLKKKYKKIRWMITNQKAGNSS